MQCANPKCRRTATDLFTGTLRMMEMEVSPEKRILRADSGFPVFAVPTRFFWMCESCSVTLTIRRWTPGGLILESRLCGPGRPAKFPPAATLKADLKKLSPGAA